MGSGGSYVPSPALQMPSQLREGWSLEPRAAADTHGSELRETCETWHVFEP